MGVRLVQALLRLLVLAHLLLGVNGLDHSTLTNRGGWHGRGETSSGVDRTTAILTHQKLLHGLVFNGESGLDRGGSGILGNPFHAGMAVTSLGTPLQVGTADTIAVTIDMGIGSGNDGEIGCGTSDIFDVFKFDSGSGTKPGLDCKIVECDRPLDHRGAASGSGSGGLGFPLGNPEPILSGLGVRRGYCPLDHRGAALGVGRGGRGVLEPAV